MKGKIMRVWIIAAGLLAVAGCHGRVDGVSLSVGHFERSLWIDHDTRDYNPEGWGLKADLIWGHMIRPVPKFWLKNQNPWKGDEPWFVIRVPMISPFISVAAGKSGVYLGCKTFKVEERHKHLGRYGRWMRPGEFPADPNGAKTYMQLSGSIRRTRWK